MKRGTVRKAGNYRTKKDHTLPTTKKDQNQDKRLEKVEKNIKMLKTSEELKYIDTLVTTPSGTAGTFTLLNGMVIGTAQNTRVGGQIYMTSVSWNLRLFSPTTNGPFAYRIIIVVDRQPNGIQFAGSGNPLTGNIALLNNAIVTAELDSFIQYENIKRFKILYDYRGAFNAQVAVDAPPSTQIISIERPFSGYKKLNLTTKYGDDIATAGAINTNAVYCLIYTSASMQTLGGFRIYFKDA